MVNRVHEYKQFEAFKHFGTELSNVEKLSLLP